MKINVFLNSSQNTNGETAKLAQKFFDGEPYQTYNLIDYHIDQLGQVTNQDQFTELALQLKKVDIIAIGTPIYWNDMTGSLKTWLDRHRLVSDIYRDKKTVILAQGSNPDNSEVFRSINHVFETFTNRFSMRYCGMVTPTKVANKNITTI
ncbi:flavodoxin family protein [Oenococcus oeni]|uniref:flavodoxin family protein n=1 Tax=Oenococcus oeni TaxID=1247 RepID=UPI00050F7AAE|nr:NAD(P)H-dependent oxidoreductase [Oenococcus oeni]KGI01376.1 hypothetical protein X293_06710 [Oenococcus oeni IOEB_C52]SYW12880.1 conserved hypothetical protein [Oenococcus oeni]